jgi:predicted metal-dependent phosphoesterase TrpH
MIKADLHIHTTFSDGRLTPAEIVTRATEVGLTTIAITDHDTFDGYHPARSEGSKHGIIVVPGVEISTIFEERETHILAYFFDVSDSGMAELMRAQQEKRMNRFFSILKNLSSLGIELEADEIMSGRAMPPGRPAIAAALQRKRIVKTVPEAFQRFLGEFAPAYTRLSFVDADEAIRIVKQAGGVSILAHPGTFFNTRQLDVLRLAGLDGVEYLHPSHPFEMQQFYRKWAESHGLLISGGSDFHGFTSRDRQFFGTVAVDASLAARLRAKAQTYKSTQRI